MKKDSRIARIALVATALLAAAAARAGDEGIYGPDAPPDSAFLRVFNATPQPLEDVRLGAEDIGEVHAYQASEFVFVAPGTHTLSAGPLTRPVKLAADRYYTAVLQDGRFALLDNERYHNRLKALVIVYNLVDAGALSLRTGDGRAAVVDAVAPNAFGTREVNAVRTTLALYEGNRRVAPVPPVTLERGRAFSLFVAGSKQQPVPVWVVN
jgi:alginate O-acetyltransferase complex protein AlgF